ncbi:MAG: hypothetical protein HRT57_06380, partial [Crocinitomicaceae bacterium]|nr:hypothetical protein [Crocinitomicaceae bacterium]
MKKFLFLLPFFALGACGDDEVKPDKSDTLELKSFKDKLSYSFGALESQKITESTNANAAKLDKAMLLEGFKSGFKSGVARNQNDPCKQTMESLFGKQGTDLDEAYLKEGSKCYG